MNSWFGCASAIGIVGVLAGCGVKQPVAIDPSPVSSNPSAADRAEQTSKRPFPELITSSTEDDRTLPVPSLIAPTGVLQRLPQVQAGRGDPFSAVATTPVIVAPNPVANSQRIPVPPEPTVLQTVPLVPSAPPTAALPPLSNSTQFPEQTIPIPAAIPRNSVSSPVQLASTIEITGVVQVGTQVSAIVQVPNEGSSRYVRPGDYLASGRVLVKRIDITPNEEPRVILVQDGVEVVRTVGNAG
jgi:predicted small lipoprotein YifL